MTRATVARSQAILTVATLSGIVCSLAATLIVGRSAAVADFALFALVALVVSVARDITDLGTSAVAVRKIARDPGAEGDALEALLAWRLLACAALAAAALGLAAMHAGATRLVLIAMAAVILVSHQNALFAVFQARQAFVAPALVNIAAQAAALAAIAAVALLVQPGIWFAVILLMRELVVILAGRALALRLLATVPSLRRGLARRGRMGATNFYSVAVLLFHATLYGGNFILTAMVPAREFAGFSAAFRPMLAAFSLSFVVAVPLAPVFARAALAPRPVFAAQVSGAWLLAVGGAGILAVVGAGLAPDIVHLLYGARFDGDGITVLTLRWLMLALVGTAAIAVYAPAILAVGRERSLCILAAAACATSLVIGFAAASRGDTAGVAAGAAVATVGAAVALTAGALGMPAIPLGIAGRAMAAPLIAAVVMAELPVATGIGRIAAGGVVAIGLLVAVWRTSMLTAYRVQQADLLRLRSQT